MKAAELIAKFQYALDNKWGYIWGTAGEKWTQEKQNKATRQQTIDYGRQWIGHYVADCSGLFSWACKQLGGYMYHGSNTMYKSYCTSKGALKAGKRTDGKTLRPGTALFTGTETEHGHVGLYIGNGYVIEAQGTKAGVVKSKASLAKWTFWGELKGVTYEDAPEPEPAPEPKGKPTIRKGDKGEYVTLAQTMLIQKGYSCGSCGADGKFGADTQYATKKFQMDNGLTPDGVIGPKTWAALETIKTILYTVCIPKLTATAADEILKKYAGSWKEEERG